MTIEQEIKGFINMINEQNLKIIDPVIYYQFYFIPPIELWDSDIKHIEHRIKDEIEYVRHLIHKADEAECLTSGIRYIRETKKRLMENK